MFYLFILFIQICFGLGMLKIHLVTVLCISDINNNQNPSLFTSVIEKFANLNDPVQLIVRIKLVTCI